MCPGVAVLFLQPLWVYTRTPTFFPLEGRVFDAPSKRLFSGRTGLALRSLDLGPPPASQAWPPLWGAVRSCPPARPTHITQELARPTVLRSQDLGDCSSVSKDSYCYYSHAGPLHADRSRSDWVSLICLDPPYATPTQVLPSLWLRSSLGVPCT